MFLTICFKILCDRLFKSLYFLMKNISIPNQTTYNYTIKAEVRSSWVIYQKIAYYIILRL